jgi:eukaryotic-like serine/threonine-protein kinase
VSPENSTMRVEGQRIGPYGLLRELGRGGMGVVYLAEREDLEKRVALKLVSGGLASPERVERFLFERRLLAQLEHPHIARVLDAGVRPDGTPWFAMEYVKGEPLDTYCDGRQLSVRDRLVLFEQVCEAVSYAHRNLVVHRDLKPSNILVTEAGEVKLLDFGIAKLLADDAQLGARSTRTETRILTPEYAAPEQICGDPITTATDVYTLGVLLYELLTGRRPYALAARGALAMELAILEEKAERPSTAVSRALERLEGEGRTASLTPELIAATRNTTVERLRRQLRGDLDTIALKALAKEPGRRYQSAERLLDDLRRHRQGLPVAARPDTLAYRAAKFVRRHRVGVVAAWLVALSLVSGLAAALWQAERAARERDVAMRERDKAEQVVGFMTGMLSAADPSEARGDTLNVYDLLARSETRVDTALARQPEVRAEMWDVLGRVYRSLGEYKKAKPLLERALASRRQILGSRHESVAETARELADVLLAQGDYKQAESLLREAVAIQRAIYGEENAKVAATLNELGDLLYSKGEYAAAGELYRHTLAVARRIRTEPLLVALSLSNLAFILRAQGRLDEAEPMLREALEIRRAELGQDHPLVPTSLSNLAVLLGEQRKYDEAESLFREALATRRRVLGDEHPEVTLTITGLAYVLRGKGDYAGAEQLFRQALAMNRKRFGLEHPSVGLDIYALARVLHEKGSMAEAESLYRTSLGVLRRTLPKNHARLTMPLVGLGSLLVSRGRAAQAEPLLREALTIREAELSDSGNLIAEAQGALGACLTELGRYEEAELLLLRAQATLLKPQRPDPERLKKVREHLLTLYTSWNKPTKAAEYRTLLASTSSEVK